MRWSAEAVIVTFTAAHHCFEYSTRWRRREERMVCSTVTLLGALFFRAHSRDDDDEQTGLAFHVHHSVPPLIVFFVGRGEEHAWW